eukprot:SRR837773.23152.p1 GENE.SRR837773.23152~~SRR837773.23152.p1  ORF type:complete len:360 (-),score=83.37 SRR837773.23152:16-1068(-)
MKPAHACGDGVGSDEFMVMLQHLTEASNAIVQAKKEPVVPLGRCRRLVARLECAAHGLAEVFTSAAVFLCLGVLNILLKMIALNHSLPFLRWCRSPKPGEVDRLTSVHWTVANLLVQLQAQQREKGKRQKLVREFLGRHGISSVLSIRVHRHLDRTQPERVRDNAEQLRTLAAELMMDLLEELHVPPFAAHPFFVNLRSKHPHLVRELCHEALHPLLKAPDDVIFMAGEVCSKMYVIISGHVQYSATVPQRDAPAGAMPTIVKRTLRGGQWLSEAALWTSWVHRGELRAVTDCLLFALDASGFARVISSHKSAHNYAAAYARKFVEGLNRGLQTDLVEALYLSEAGGNDQ